MFVYFSDLQWADGNPDPDFIVCMPAFLPYHMCRGQMTFENRFSSSTMCGSQGLKSSHQVQQQVPLPAKPSRRPLPRLNFQISELGGARVTDTGVERIDVSLLDESTANTCLCQRYRGLLPRAGQTDQGPPAKTPLAVQCLFLHLPICPSPL